MDLPHSLSIFFFFFVSFTDLSLSSSPHISQIFEAWCERHNKTYTSPSEKLHRLRIFEDNHSFVTSHNGESGSSFKLDLNGFADLEHSEFRASRLGLAAAPPGRLRRRRRLVVGEVPSSVDWRKEGAVSGVKDQGNCGGCWSFSTTGAIEGINKIVTGSLVSLSEQELIDCDKSVNSGCGGGLMDYAYEFVVHNHGIDTEEDYPYKARDGTCNKDKLKRHVVTIDGYSDVPSNNEKQLLQAVAVQPVSVGICGSERTFQLYSKGVYTGPCSTSLDHAVLIVGYGSENGVDYWIVKNSWGKRWGMNGYIHMQRNNGNSQGLCGINMLASYPTKTSQNPPPAPPPGPTRCDLFTRCSDGETCCCAKSIFGICLSWKCCGSSSAVCCSDRLHCCPHDHPACDTKRSACLQAIDVCRETSDPDEFRIKLELLLRRALASPAPPFHVMPPSWSDSPFFPSCLRPGRTPPFFLCVIELQGGDGWMENGKTDELELKKNYLNFKTFYPKSIFVTLQNA